MAGFSCEVASAKNNTFCTASANAAKSLPLAPLAMYGRLLSRPRVSPLWSCSPPRPALFSVAPLSLLLPCLCILYPDVVIIKDRCSKPSKYHSRASACKRVKVTRRRQKAASAQTISQNQQSARQPNHTTRHHLTPLSVTVSILSRNRLTLPYKQKPRERKNHNGFKDLDMIEFRVQLIGDGVVPRTDLRLLRSTRFLPSAFPARSQPHDNSHPNGWCTGGGNRRPSIRSVPAQP